MTEQQTPYGNTPKSIFDQVFLSPRTPRSPEYKAGVMAALEFRFARTPIRLPYPAGTAQADAFFAGIDEGHALWRSQGGPGKA